MSEEMAAYMQVTRQMVTNLQHDLIDYKKRMNGSLDKIDNRLASIEKCLDSRPSWLASITITALTGLCTGLITFLITHK